jgi:hypothetical protein
MHIKTYNVEVMIAKNKIKIILASTLSSIFTWMPYKAYVYMFTKISL